jgi:hypothetical protein
LRTARLSFGGEVGRRPGEGAFRRAVTAFFLCAALALPLAACSGFTPVYGEGAAARSMAFSHAAPRDRLEQVIYQELALRLGRSETGPHLEIAATATVRDLTLGDVRNPRDAREATVSATATVRDAPGGRTLLTVSRSASASFTVSAQGLAATSAETEARERAARAAAESLRLALLAALTR